MPLFAFGIALLIGASLIYVGSLTLFKTVIDGLVGGAATLWQVQMWVGLYLAFQMLARFLSDYGFYVYGRFDQRVQRALGNYVFNALHRLSFSVYVGQKMGSLAHIVDHGFSGFRNVFQPLFIAVLPLAFDLAFVCAVLWFFFGSLLSILALAFMALTLWITVRFSRKIDLQHQTVMAHIRSAFGLCFDSLLNYETVKYFGNEHFIGKTFKNKLLSLEKVALCELRSITYLSCTQSLLSALFMVLMLVFIGQRWGGHTFGVGDIVMINMYMLQLTAPLKMIGHQIRTIKNGLIEVETLLDLIHQKSDSLNQGEGTHLTSIKEITVQNLSFSHTKGKPVLTNMSFTLKKGERVALVGGSGSGKTTVTRLFFRLFDATQGKILINGQDIRHYNIVALRKRLSIVPQDVVLFHDTLRNNIRFGNTEASDSEIEEAALRAGLTSLVQTLEEGLDSVVGERGMKLSGGERQRVGIARAILRKPDLYIFDEATSSLDTQTEKRIQENLKAILKGKTALVIAHRLSTVTDCDRILVLDRGNIAQSGTHKELLKKKGLYANLWQAQAKEKR